MLLKTTYNIVKIKVLFYSKDKNLDISVIVLVCFKMVYKIVLLLLVVIIKKKMVHYFETPKVELDQLCINAKFHTYLKNLPIVKSKVKNVEIRN